MSLAALSSVVETDPVRRAYAWLLAAGAVATSPTDFIRDPAFSVVPRGSPRMPARSVRCSQ